MSWFVHKMSSYHSVPGMFLTTVFIVRLRSTAMQSAVLMSVVLWYYVKITESIIIQLTLEGCAIKADYF